MIPFWKKTDKHSKPQSAQKRRQNTKPAVPRTAQQSIPMQRMFEDGTCRVKANYYTRTIQYQDINYQLAQQEDKTAIFEEWCSFLNFFDSSIKFELSFVNMATDSTEFEKSIRIPYQRDGFDDVRAEYLRFKNAHKVNFVRYADDFVVTAATPELALEAKELIREFLAERGLELSDEKTVVTNIDDGFDFLGWNFRKYNEKLIIKPSQKAVKAIVSNISDTILRRGKAWQQDVLIMKLNEQIRGWTNYHQSVCASDAFAHLDYVLYELLWRWAKRRHPKKNKWWISTRYWHRVGNRNWVFSTENKELIRVDSTAIVRHTKIKATANPFLDEAYFQKRKFDKGMHRLTGKFKMIWKNQNGLCYHCGMPMDVTEEREIFYLAPKAKAGMEDVRNMRYVHCTCQRIYAENRLKK